MSHLHVFSNGKDFLVASDVLDARTRWESLDWGEPHPGVEFTQVPSEERLEIRNPELPVTRTASEWARITPPGLLCVQEEDNLDWFRGPLWITQL